MNYVTEFADGTWANGRHEDAARVTARVHEITSLVAQMRVEQQLTNKGAEYLRPYEV